MDGAATACHAAATLSERGDARVLAAVDEAGGITLVGCTSELSRSALTTVAQELLVYTGRLWRMPTDDLVAVFEKALGRSLADHVSSRVAIGWSEKSFRAGLRECLDQGRFPVVLLLADTSDEVAEVFDHLQSHNFSVRLLRVEAYDCDGIEVVMPKLLASTEPGLEQEEEPVSVVERAPEPEPAYVEAEPEAEPEPGQESEPTSKMPWSDLPSPTPDELEAATAAQVADSSGGESEPELESAAESAETEAAVAEEAIEEPEPVPQPERAPAAKAPPAAKLKPVVGKPPAAPRPAPMRRSAYDGTMPGIMAGKRPPPKPAVPPGPRKEQEEKTRRG
jgi:hypothetical protein